MAGFLRIVMIVGVIVVLLLVVLVILSFNGTFTNEYAQPQL